MSTRINPVGTAARERQDAEMLKSPKNWPLWPVLSLKRRFDRPDPTGPNFAMVSADYPTILLKERPTVRGILLQLMIEGPDFRGSGAARPTKADEDKYKSMVLARYATAEDVAKDWTVD